jgi:hypothetical protein
MTAADIAAWTAASRRAQGLPEQVEDQALLARIARLVDAGERAGGDAQPAA